MKNLALLVVLFISFAQAVQAQEYGLASYYSDKFHGRPTASGETYDKDKMTAAHKTHPYGTLIRVTRLDNKKSVVVRVNDRGPYISGRVVDVSRKAADQLDLTADGTARVKVEVVQAPAEGETAAPAPPVVESKPRENPPPATTTPKVEKPKEPAKVVTPKETAPVAKADPKPKTDTKPKATEPATTPPSSAGTSVDGAVWVTEKNYQSYDLYKIELYKPEKAGFAVQVASLSTYDNAMKQVAELQGKWLKNVLLSIEKASNGSAVYKIMLGPFPDKEQAEAYRKNIKKRFKMDGFVVDLSTITY